MVGIVILLAAFGDGSLKHSSGADPGYTNSPADGQNCTHCMGGTAVAVTGWITSDIPVTGYVPGETYNITVTATGAGKKGFEVSPQAVSGNLLGTLVAGTGTKLIGSNNQYVTHSSAPSTNPKSWTFQWVAPPSGTGEVTFYGSIAVTKTATKTTTMSVTQSTVGITKKEKGGFSIYPNPAHRQFSVSFALDCPADIHFELLAVNGSLLSTLSAESLPAGTFTRTFTLDQPAGLYYVRMNYGGRDHLSKIILQ
jgi:hypothetical protein